MNPWLGITGVVAMLGLLMAALKALGRFVSIPPEVSRKTVHIGMGLACLSFPWIFAEKWPSAVLAGLAVVALSAIRLTPFLRARLGSVLGGVQRESLGEIYFPIAVAAVFYLSGNAPLLYIIPVLTLTLADSVGALIGVRYGLARYRTDDGMKSTEGSIAFFTVAFLSCHVPLLLFSNTGRAETLLIGLTAGFTVMLLEAIAWRGQDNMIIPLGMFFLLHSFLPLGVTALLWRLFVIVALVLWVLIWRERTTLSNSAVLAAALSGYAVWAFGGWLWLAAPLLLFIIYVMLPPFPGERPIQSLRAVTRVMAGGFLWLLAAKVTGKPNFLLPYLLCLAAHTGNIMTARLRVVRPELPLSKVFLWGLLVPTASFGLLTMVGCGFSRGSVMLVPLSVAISITLFVFAWPTEHTSANRVQVWLAETLIAILASLPGLWITLLS
jgi:phytol kinase